ncbi:MAG: PKD domain-containing protein [Pseudomonadales bacterium]
MNINFPVLDWRTPVETIFAGRKSWIQRLCVALVVLASGCDGDTSSLPAGFVPNTSPDNQNPIADAGANLTGSVGRLLVLDGSASSDPDGDILLMQWLIESSPTGSRAEILNANDTVASLTPDVAGTYVVSLGVTDGGLTAQDSLTIEVAAAGAAVANAGPDQAVTVSTLVRLDASGSSAGDNSQLSYRWEIRQRPQGSNTELSTENAVNPTFTPDVAGSYVIDLLVTDANGSSASDEVVVQVGTGNQSPIANAGADQAVAAGSVVTLNGAASNDPNGDLLSFQWTLTTVPSGSSATFANAASAMPTFTADVVGTYTATLTVSDAQSTSSADQVTVIASVTQQPNVAPAADAGEDQSVSTGQRSVLNGSDSSDPDGDALTYLWQFVSRPNGSSANLANAALPNAEFTPDVDGSFVLELTVSDGELTDSDRVLVTAASGNGAPVASAGPDQNVSVGTRVQMNGTGSMDPNDDSLTYAWLLNSKPSGSSAVLNRSNIVAPRFTADQAGTYVLRLTVNDGSQSSVEDSVVITASSGNSAPVADAGSNVSAEVGGLITLDGRNSSDADGDSLSYQWSLSNRPSGSTAVLSSPTNSRPSLSIDVAGTYVASLVVSDGQLSSAADAVTITAASGNRAPNANAGANQTVATGATVTLNGTASSDADGDSLGYSWTLTSRPSGSAAALINPTSDTPRFTTDRAGTYVARLIVNDGQVDSAADTVNIISTSGNAAPVANAGNDRTVDVGSLVQLSASGSNDPDGDSLTYSWSITSRPSGSSAALNSTTSGSPRFTADVSGSYSVRLVVNDGSLSSSPDTINITANSGNNLPVADAGSNQSVTTGQLVQLNGGNSSDTDGDSLTYTWSVVSRPSGSSATLNSTSGASTSFTADRSGNYTVRLVVNDGTGNSAPDTVSISASTSNQAPTASAGSNQSVDTGDVVNLDGSGSSDPDGDTLTYSWTLSTRPSGSSASLINANRVNPRFTADVAGTFRARLTVNDGTVSSSTSTVTITATASGNGGNGSNVSDDFAGNGPLLGYTTNNASALPDVERVNGRYRANLTDNTDDVTLHFNNEQGRLDAKRISFPFEYIAYNIGIGTQSNSQTAPNPNSGSPYMFAGIQVHVTSLSSRNSAHVVVGHRGPTRFTIEGKNTVNGDSTTNDDGEDVLPLGRADIRIVGDSSRSLTVYYRAPNSNNSWIPYRGTGKMPGTEPNFGSEVYIGLITYAFRASSAGFVGTADRVELVGE